MNVYVHVESSYIAWLYPLVLVPLMAFFFFDAQQAVRTASILCMYVHYHFRIMHCACVRV